MVMSSELYAGENKAMVTSAITLIGSSSSWCGCLTINAVCMLVWSGTGSCWLRDGRGLAFTQLMPLGSHLDSQCSLNADFG